MTRHFTTVLLVIFSVLVLFPIMLCELIPKYLAAKLLGRGIPLNNSRI